MNVKRDDVLNIDIDSLVFRCLLNDLNSEIKRVVEKVWDKEFSEGEISLKLKLSFPTTFKEYPKLDVYGNTDYESYEYRKPDFEHKVSTTLKKQYKTEGFYSEEREVKRLDEGEYVAVALKEPQISLFDKEEDDFI